MSNRIYDFNELQEGLEVYNFDINSNDYCKVTLGKKLGDSFELIGTDIKSMSICEWEIRTGQIRLLKD